MKKNSTKDLREKRELVAAAFSERENETYHHGYDKELLQYELLREGDSRAVEENRQFFRSINAVHLSDDPLRERKYLFVVSATLATRFAIEGGMNYASAYQLSDLHIRRMDRCMTIEEVDDAQTAMIADFTERMAEIRSKRTEGQSQSPVSKPVHEAMDYVYRHLHSKITLAQVGEAVSLSPNHLNALFKAQKGVTLHRYIRSQKIEAAKNMLLYTDYSETEIAEYLAFSSPAHFIRVFREDVGMTPRVFLQQFYRTHPRWNDRYPIKK